VCVRVCVCVCVCVCGWGTCNISTRSPRRCRQTAANSALCNMTDLAVQHDSFWSATWWLNHVCDVSQLYTAANSAPCDMTHSDVRYALLGSAPWLVRKCDMMSHLRVWRKGLTHVCSDLRHCSDLHHCKSLLQWRESVTYSHVSQFSILTAVWLQLLTLLQWLLSL